MSWSFGEIRALAIKAARGSGMEWGMAEEAGFATVWLEENGAHGVKAFANYLEYRKTLAESGFSTCPIHLGAAICDNGKYSSHLPANVLSPLLLAPFIASALDRQSVKLSWANLEVFISPNGLYYENIDCTINKNLASCEVSSPHEETGVFKKQSRTSADAQAYVNILNQFAHKTYAPATEESRLAGAGAGLTDND